MRVPCASGGEGGGIAPYVCVRIPACVTASAVMQMNLQHPNPTPSLPPPPAPSQFYGFLSPLLERLRMDVRYLQRNLNEGFSGGEKKRNEILQLAVRDRGRGVGLRIRRC